MAIFEIQISYVAKITPVLMRRVPIEENNLRYLAM